MLLNLKAGIKTLIHLNQNILPKINQEWKEKSINKLCACIRKTSVSPPNKQETVYHNSLYTFPVNHSKSSQASHVPPNHHFIVHCVILYDHVTEKLFNLCTKLCDLITRQIKNSSEQQ